MAHSNKKQVLQGSVNHFGPRYPETHLATENDVLVRTMVVPLVAQAGVASLTPEPIAGDTANMIPAHAMILSAHLFSIEDFDGEGAGTVTVGITGNTNGLFSEDNDEFSADDWYEADGDAVGASVGSNPVNVVAAFSSAHGDNEGRGVMVVRYIPAPVHVASEGAIDA